MPQFGHSAGAQALGQDLLPGYYSKHWVPACTHFGFSISKAIHFIPMTSPLGGGGTPHNGLNGEVPPKRGTFFGLQVYQREGISLCERGTICQ